VLDEKLKEYGVKYRMLDFGEVEFYEDFTQEQHSIFKEKLQDYGIEVIESQK
jgi:hypothetical protein